MTFDTKVSDTNVISKTETFIREDRERRLLKIFPKVQPIPFQHFNRT